MFFTTLIYMLCGDDAFHFWGFFCRSLDFAIFCMIDLFFGFTLCKRQDHIGFAQHLGIFSYFPFRGTYNFLLS